MDMRKETYIIIPVHNRKQITIACLENLNACSDLQKYHVLVIDDDSTDGTAEAIRSRFPMVEIFTGNGNLWWTGAIARNYLLTLERSLSGNVEAQADYEWMMLELFDRPARHYRTHLVS